MKNLFLVFLIAVVSCRTSKKEMVNTPVVKSASEECILLAEIFNPKNSQDYPLQLCMYTHTEVRGIYMATACVAVLIEGQSGVRHPFYGSKGHWGIEGNCEANAILKKIQDPQTMKTVNPISDLKMKRKQGRSVKIITDTFGLGDTLLEVTK